MGRRGGLELGALGVLTAVAYGALYQVQRSLSDNGLATSTPHQFPRDDADLGQAAEDLRRYLLVVGLLCLLYAWVLVRAPRWTNRQSALSLLVPGAIQAVLVFRRPTLSIDPYSYLAHGYLASHPPLNPYAQEAAAVSALPYGEALRLFGWLPMHPQSPYGPLWTALERLVVWSTESDVATALVLVKLPAVLAAWGAAGMIFLLLRSVAAELRWAGTLGWLWSPMVTVEFAGDGHIDAVMIMLVLVACYAAVRGWAYRATLGLGLAVLVKYLPVVFAAPILVSLLHRAPAASRCLGRVLLAVATALVLTVLAFAPYWRGADTFVGVVSSGTPYPAWTPSGMIVTWFNFRFGEEGAARVAQGVLAGLLFLVVLLVCLRVRTAAELLRGSAVIALVAFGLLPGGWPWYAALPVALLLCLPTVGARALVLVLTVSTRSIACFGDLQLLGAVPLESTADIDGCLGVTLPLLVGLPVALALWWRAGGRSSLGYERLLRSPSRRPDVT
ncbi:MAG: hypothetical protein ACLGIF_05285 [Actinomycetes bacterium]